MDYFDAFGGFFEHGSRQKKKRKADLKLKEKSGANRMYFYSIFAAEDHFTVLSKPLSSVPSSVECVYIQEMSSAETS